MGYWDGFNCVNYDFFMVMCVNKIVFDYYRVVGV